MVKPLTKDRSIEGFCGGCQVPAVRFADTFLGRSGGSRARSHVFEQRLFFCCWHSYQLGIRVFKIWTISKKILLWNSDVEESQQSSIYSRDHLFNLCLAIFHHWTSILNFSKYNPNNNLAAFLCKSTSTQQFASRFLSFSSSVVENPSFSTSGPQI